jgi:hypothetical protein
MSYYRDSAGNVAKVIFTAGRVVVMVGFRTFFFTDDGAARSFLGARGYF